MHVRNDADTEATVHWHGLRLDNRYDGVPHETQAPDPGRRATSPTGSGSPTPGLYWYHPHIREDYGLDMGLYGNLVVVPSDAGYWAPVNREVVVTLDDVLVEDGRIAPFNRRRSDPRGDGPLRQRHAHRRRDEPRARGRRRRGRALLPHQHRQHPALQRRGARRPHEAGRRRQRPRTSTRPSSTRCCWRRRSGPSSTCCSTRPARSPSSTARRTTPTCSARSWSTGERGDAARCATEFEQLRTSAELTGATRPGLDADGDRAPGQDAGLRVADAAPATATPT